MIPSIDLTIIIPHYNVPDLLEKLIKSIPGSEEIQVIVVDDNSDKQKEKLAQVESLYKERVEFYINDTGIKSAGSCRNIGLEHARGKWILFADADDYFLPDMYDIVKCYFETNYDMIFFTPTSVVIETGEISNRHLKCERVIQNYIKTPSEVNEIALKSVQTEQPWSKLIRRELIEKYNVRFSQSLHWNDILFSTIIGYYSKEIYASEEKIYCVTKSKGTLTTYMDECSYDIRLEEYIKHCRFLLEHYSSSLCKKLHVTGAGKLYMAFQQHYGIKKYAEVIIKFKRNHIPIFNINTLNPCYLYMRIKKSKLKKKQDEKYCIK